MIRIGAASTKGLTPPDVDSTSLLSPVPARGFRLAPMSANMSRHTIELKDSEQEDGPSKN